MLFITGKYPLGLLKQRNYIVPESEGFIVITGISPSAYISVRLLLTPLFQVLSGMSPELEDDERLPRFVHVFWHGLMPRSTDEYSD